MSITSTGRIYASQRIDGGGNQSPRRLAKLGYELTDLNGDWEQGADYQVWYMNDDIYRLNKEKRDKFERVLATAKDIKVVLNFVIGDTHRQDWVLKYPVSKIIFLNNEKKRDWEGKVKGTAKEMIPTEQMFAPIDIEKFTGGKSKSDKLRIGRHSRISLKYPEDPCSLYRKLDTKEREFHFMLAHPKIAREFPHFKCYGWNEKPVEEFLADIDIYLAIIHPKTKEQGGRSNMEAMASGCLVIVEDRDGPQDYIKHGKTGFLVKSEDEAVDIINNLTKDEIKRIGANARKYAIDNFKIDLWQKKLLK